MRQVPRAGALGRPRGIGWRGRWEGKSGWGIHVNPRLIHVNVRQKPLQYCKVISLQLITINEKKKKRIHLPMQETEAMQVLSLGQGDPLEKEMATHSTILAGKFHGQRSLVGYNLWVHKELDMTERLSMHNMKQRMIYLNESDFNFGLIKGLLTC